MPRTKEATSRSDEDWKRELTPREYEITREGGTEAPFSGAYWDHKGSGAYRCRCCDAELFSSETKYDSGSGWPSFWKPEAGANVRLLEDPSHGMDRTEVRCGACDAHLGHVFEDGPEPTGLRYCINSASLRFRGADEDSESTNPK